MRAATRACGTARRTRCARRASSTSACSRRRAARSRGRPWGPCRWSRRRSTPARPLASRRRCASGACVLRARDARAHERAQRGGGAARLGAVVRAAHPGRRRRHGRGAEHVAAAEAYARMRASNRDRTLTCRVCARVQCCSRRSRSTSRRCSVSAPSANATRTCSSFCRRS